MSRMQSHWGADALSKELPDQSKARGHDGNVYTQLELHDEISQIFGSNPVSSTSACKQ